MNVNVCCVLLDHVLTDMVIDLQIVNSNVCGAAVAVSAKAFHLSPKWSVFSATFGRCTYKRTKAVLYHLPIAASITIVLIHVHYYANMTLL